MALFDSRIEQTRSKLSDVQDREERCAIVQQELLVSRQKLERDCAKARTYQELRDRFQRGRLQEQVLGFEQAESQFKHCLLYTSPSPRDATLSRMPSSA